MTMNEMGAQAKTAARALANAGALKESALLHAAGALRQRREELLAANALDVQAGREAGMSQALLDRLSLTEARIQDMAAAVEEVAKSADPVGKTLSGQRLPNGLQLEKVTVPLGVIGIIYEARPNVTSDAAALCLKAGNAVILRGGKEAFRSNQAVVKVLREALAEGGLPADCVQLVEDTSRQSAQELMALTEYLDVLIPRGGAGLIRSVKENARVPVIETGVGNCHVYVDKDADLNMAANIIYNAKCSRPSVCNAIETILVHQNVAEEALPLIRRFYDMGFNIEATRGTAEFPKANGIRTRIRKKLSEGSEEILDSLRQGHVNYVINTREPANLGRDSDGAQIRRCAVENNVTMFTALDTVRVLLEVLEEITLCISTIDS